MSVRLTALRQDRGATAAEYALLIALIAGVIVFGVMYFGQQVLPKFSHTGSCLESVSSC